MKIGIGSGSRGAEVTRLHRVLHASGFLVEASETREGLFGASTLEALHELQRRRGLPLVDVIDRPTLEVLLEIEQNITINIDESGTPKPAPKPDETHGKVTGTLVDGDGAPVVSTRVALFSEQLRSETQLGEAQTSAKGEYAIRYRRHVALNLLVRAYDASGNVIATSPTSFAAPAQVVIDFTTGKDGVVRSPSTFTTLQAKVLAQLGNTPLSDLKENKDTHEISFVASSIGEPFSQVAYLFMAHVLGAKNALRDETLFGIFYEGIPVALGPAFGDLPDAGIDDAFMSQAFSGVLSHSRDSLGQALTTAVAGDVLPASYADTQDLELSRLDDLRVQATASTPYIRGKTAVSDLLTAGSVSQAVQAAFLAAFAANSGRLGPAWTALRANKNLPAADLTTLKTTLSLGELLTGNLPLVKDTLQRLSQKTLERISDLGMLDQNDWIARISAIDPQAASIPQVLPNDTPATRIARFAKALAERFAGRYPTQAFVGGLTKATSTSFQQTKTELISVLTANPTLNLKIGNIDQYVATNKVTMSAQALTDLKTAQRLLRVSPHYSSVEALNANGFQSAQSVYFAGRDNFIAKMTKPLGSAALAQMAFGRAQMTYATALHLYARLSLAFNNIGLNAIASSNPPPGSLPNFPDLQLLFGQADYFQCEDCQSIYSPAAYLVDLLQWLKGLGATPQGSAVSQLTTAFAAVIFRRPEIPFIALSCNNTNVTIPYIDLVNEILENYISPTWPPKPQTGPYVIDTLGTSAERRALPQYVQDVSGGAYDKTKQTVFPLTLPFDWPFAQTTAYLAAMGVPRASVMSLFVGAPSGPTPVAIACASLGLSSKMQALVEGTDPSQQWDRWGFDKQNSPDNVIDPETRQPLSPAPSTWVAALGYVPLFLNRSGLTLRQLYQLLEVVWVTNSAVTLQLGVQGGIAQSHVDLMQFNGLTANVLDRAQQFLRLLAATGLQMWELDWALGSQTVNDTVLTFLAGAIALGNQLKLPFQEVLSFWQPLQVRDVTNHLGDEDAVVPSTYSEVFTNPTMYASWSGVFPRPAQPPPNGWDLGGSAISTTPTNLSAITAALGISANDVASIMNATNMTDSLTLANVNVLLRYQRLATSQSLTISDLLLWIQLTAGTPFGTTPVDTQEFLRRLGVLKGTGLGVHDLDYLLRNGSITQTALAFTTQQSTTLLQAIAGGLAKLTAAQQADAPTVSALFIGALATATNVTADVVTPVLNKTGVLPLSAATIQQLLQNPTVDPSQFPQLVGAFVAVAKAAALYTALGASVVEWMFIVQNAASFGWLDPSALPSTSTSPYAAFEALLQAIKLDRRQTARAPKLFDILGQWLPPGQLPASPAAALGTTANPGLAYALNGQVDDATAIATALGAKTPTLPPSPGTLTDMTMLTSIANALDVVTRYRVSGATLFALAAAAPDATTAQAAYGAFQQQYAQSAWFGAVQPVEDGLRQSRRDALVAYLLGPGSASAPLWPFLTTDDIYDYFLIDPEMSACAVTTRLLQASIAIQLFVQQCFLNLSVQVNVNTASNSSWNQWSWRKTYELWSANRQVFLYPENYVLPETRKSPSPFFVDMEQDLRQASCDEDLAETALQNYLRKLVDASQLIVAAHYNDAAADVLHVFAHTRHHPWKWWYRARTAGVWSPWSEIGVDIPSDQVVAVLWDRRLHLVWLLFKQEAEKQSNQQVPSSGDNQPPPVNIWSVDVAMTELSAGKWQPKRVYPEKMFFTKNVNTSTGLAEIDRPKIAFTLRASPDNAFNLIITVYYSYTEVEYGAKAGIASLGQSQPVVLPAVEVAICTLSMPEAPLKVVQDNQVATNILPDGSLMDLAQEPSYSLVVPTTLTGTLTAPTGYSFWAQDLVYGAYYNPNTGTVPVNVLGQTSATGTPTNVLLLKKAVNARIVVPPQEAVFDSLDPFFVVDGGGGSGTSPRPVRTYLIQPEFFTISSNPQELDNLKYVRQWTTYYDFRTFYHPFARTMLRELEIGGVAQMMSRNLQINPQGVRGWSTTFDFNGIFTPQPPVRKPYPGQPNASDVGESALDFSNGGTGAYSLYNWEVFYHAPMYVASLLTQNQQYQDAMTWYEYIFNPSDSSGWSTPQRFWEMAPLYNLNSNQWVGEQIQNILQGLAQGVSDSDTTAALNVYMNDPFDPHAIASLRIAAYGKATFMKFLDNLIAWGDSLFSNYTSETVAQAEQLYVLADTLLGPAPQEVRPPPGFTSSVPATYDQIAAEIGTSQFPDPLVAVENLVIAPTPTSEIIQGTAVTPPLPQIPTKAGTLLFCVPPNAQLLAYWSTVADRLYKIRHCMNLQGQVVPLPLYGPPINPLLAAEAGAAGQTPSGLSAPAPIYRFATYLQKAVELANDVRSFGALILAALEKEDAESLALLRANQELDIQTQMLDVKTQQVTETTDEITALQNQQAISKIKAQFYSTQPFTNAMETQALGLQAQAYMTNQQAIPLDAMAMQASIIPTYTFGVEGAGGTPATTASFGGGNVAASVSAMAASIRAQAGLYAQQAGTLFTQGGFQHRADEWGLQAQVANAEVTQLDSQILAANDRLTIANTEVNIQTTQINNAQNVSDFLTNKYTNAQLYDWMVTQLTTVHTQAYQLAFGLAQQAQYAYQYELGSQDTFLQPDYWDDVHRGLTAGDSLLFDLRRMEARYLAQNARELELTKHISLAITQPMALVQLMKTGTCQVYLDEALFDADHPGQIFRRLRSVALTIPCVTGPYTGVNANLTLTTAVTRTTTTLSGSNYVPASAKSPPSDPAFSVSYPPGATISTSSGQNDAGLFEVNLRDERWLPFEGQGAISAWNLELNPLTNNFDFSTITDVILHVRYTARVGNPPIPEQTVLQAIAPPTGATRAIAVSVKCTFGDALYAFFNPTDTTATQEVLTLPITNALFPWSNIRTPMIGDISVFFALSQTPSGNVSIPNVTFGPTSGTASALAIGSTPLPTGWTAPAALLYGDASLSQPVAPQSFTLTVPTAGLPTALARTVGSQTLLDPNKVQDIILIITYVS